MENHQYLAKFSDDVIEFEENKLRKVGNLRAWLIELFEDKNCAEKRLREHFKHYGLEIKEYFKFKKTDGKEIEYPNFWFEEGVKCSLLRVGSQKWLKGKIKISVNVEFYPDEPIKDSQIEPPSILDDIRQTIN